MQNKQRICEIDLLKTWKDCSEYFDRGLLLESAEKFESLIELNPTQGVSKLCYNVAVIYDAAGNAIKALQYLKRCLEKDPHNSMAYFRRGVILYEMERYAEAAKDFQECAKSMRQLTVIDYTQLGLTSKLYMRETLHNEAACHLRLGSKEKCLEALYEVEDILRKESNNNLRTLDTQTLIQQVQAGATQINIIAGSCQFIYKPPTSKINALAKKDYLGKAKVVSSVQSGDTFSGFTGAITKSESQEKPSSSRPQSPIVQSKLEANGVTQHEQILKVKGLLKPIPPERPSSPRPCTPLIQRKENSAGLQVEQTCSETGPTKSPLARLLPPPVPQPKLCDIELICGDVSSHIKVPVNCSYESVLRSVSDLLGYDVGAFTLWYINRKGLYTPINNQDMIEHVWKWKLVDSKVTMYVFSV